jgi:hypothetical protein
MANGAHKQLREEVADLDHRIGKQIEALEQGVEPQLLSAPSHNFGPRHAASASFSA